MEHPLWNAKQTRITAIVLAILLPLFLLVSCNKKLSEYNEDFLGTWRTIPTPQTTPGDSVRYEIVIEENDAIYRYSCESVCPPKLCDCLGEQAGKAVVNSDRTLIRIGSSGAQPLSIEAEPYLDANGKWVMRVGSLTYYKQ